MNYFLQKISDLKNQNLYRKLINVDFVSDVVVKKNNRKLICFSSNDYFSLANNFCVKLSAIFAVLRFGAGSRGSRYVCGNNSLYEKLEAQIAKMQNCDDAIVFPSGYQAAVGVIPALVGENDLVIADKLIHSSLIDGVKLSGAKMIRFAHNDIKHARQVILNNTEKYQKILIITEEIFSMDGDRGDVEALQMLAQEFNAMLLIDGAHSLYNVGAGSPRLCDKLQINNSGRGDPDPTVIKMGTLSKAVGVLGGYVAGDKNMIDYLRNFSKTAIYTTALAPSVLAASLASLKIIEKKNLSKKTLENAEYFCKLMNLPKPQSAIVVVIIGDALKTVQIANKVEENGFLISAIRPPTVEPNKSRLRITFSSKHKKCQIEKLARVLQELL